MIIAIIVLVIALIGIAYYLFPPIQIVGESMYPTYYDGEIIFGRRIYSKKKLKRGDVIVYVSPDSQNPDSLDHGRRIVIKRIERISYNYRDEQLFYCKQRGISEEDAVGLIVNGFCKEVMQKLPMEFAIEASKLIEISLEGSVG